MDAFKKDILKGSSPTDGESLSLLLLKKFKVTKDSLKDVRIVFVSMSAVLDIHDDVGHHDSVKKLLTFHMNLF